MPRLMISLILVIMLISVQIAVRHLFVIIKSVQAFDCGDEQCSICTFLKLLLYLSLPELRIW